MFLDGTQWDNPLINYFLYSPETRPAQKVVELKKKVMRNKDLARVIWSYLYKTPMQSIEVLAKRGIFEIQPPSFPSLNPIIPKQNRWWCLCFCCFLGTAPTAETAETP